MIKKNYSELFEFTSAQLATLKKEYEPLKGKTMSMAQINKMNSMLSRYSKDMLIKLANTDIPFLATSAKSQLVMKRGMKWSDFKTPLDMSEADELQCEACWTGYKQVGFKKKGDRRVPNCVPESVVKEMLGEVNDIRGSFTDAQLERMKQDWKNKPASALTQGVKQMIMNLDAPTRAALEQAKINHVSKFAGSTFEQKESVDPTCPICEGDGCQCPQGEDVQEAIKVLYDKDYNYKKQTKEFSNKKDAEKFVNDIKQKGGKAVIVSEADLSKSQVKMVHKKADDLSKKDFIKRYGKDGDSVRYATATNIVKKKLGIEEEEFVPEQKEKGENMNEATYKDKFNAAMKDFGINSLDDLKSDAEKKKFFKHVDGMHKAKNEELTPAQKKLPAGLQKAIAKKQDDKKDEGFASDAQRKAAFASGYKEKGKKKKEEVSEMMSPQEMMKMNAMKMPIRAMYMKATKEKKDIKEILPALARVATRVAPVAVGYSMGKSDSKKEMKTGDDDMKPMTSMKMNAVTDPKKMNAMTMQDPKQDMAAGYMKSDVRAAVKNGGGDDMSKVKDKPEMMAAMKKINAMYKKEKYLPVKEGSIQDTVAKMQSVEEQQIDVKGKELDKMIADYLKKGGTISKLPPALAKGMKPSEMKPHKLGAKGVIKSMYKMKEVREFISTYNSHFLTNYKAEEFVVKNRLEG